MVPPITCPTGIGSEKDRPPPPLVHRANQSPQTILHRSSSEFSEMLVCRFNCSACLRVVDVVHPRLKDGLAKVHTKRDERFSLLAFLSVEVSKPLELW